MSLEIYLARSYARPGSTVGGTVITHLEAGSSVHVKNYAISLFGRFRTRPASIDGVTADLAGRDEVFLHKVFKLYDEPVTLSDQRVSSWRFTFPEYPEIPGRKREIFTGMPRPDPQVLPPSGSLGQGVGISYSLEVSAVDEWSGRLLEATAPLTFSLTREDETMPETLIVQERSMSGRSNSDSRRMVLNCPMAVVQEKPFPLELRLRSETADSSAFSSSTICLKDCQLHLVQKTVVGDPSTGGSAWIEEHLISPHGPTTGPTPVKIRAPNAVSILHHATIPMTIMPTFSCFGIQRSYSFSARFNVAFENEIMDYVFAVGEIILMPKETRAEAFLFEVNASGFNDPEDDELPGSFMSAT